MLHGEKLPGQGRQAGLSQKLLLLLQQAIPAAAEREVCDAEGQKWVVATSASASDLAPEVHKTIGSLLSFHILRSCSYHIASTAPVVLEFADEASGLSETVRLPKAVTRLSRIEAEIFLAVRSERSYHPYAASSNRSLRVDSIESPKSWQTFTKEYGHEVSSDRTQV